MWRLGWHLSSHSGVCISSGIAVSYYVIEIAAMCSYLLFPESTPCTGLNHAANPLLQCTCCLCIMGLIYYTQNNKPQPFVLLVQTTGWPSMLQSLRNMLISCEEAWMHVGVYCMTSMGRKNLTCAFGPWICIYYKTSKKNWVKLVSYMFQVPNFIDRNP